MTRVCVCGLSGAAIAVLVLLIGGLLVTQFRDINASF